MSWVAAHFAVVGAAVVFVFATSLVLQEQRAPQSTLAWMAFVILLPYLAIPAFVALGVRKRRVALNRPMPPVGPGPVHDLAALLAGYGVAAPSSGNRLSFEADGQAAYASVMDLVEGARSSISVAIYILGDDAVGRAFCAALTERARQGVKVRVILDLVGALGPPRRMLKELRRAGGEIRVFAPLLHRPFEGRLNLRNHRKVVIVDGRTVWAGGRNIAAEYMGPEPDPDRWQDMSFRLTGPAVADFVRLFASDWQAAGGTGAPEPAEPTTAEGGSDTPMWLLPSGPDTARDPLHDALTYACHAAQRRIWIVSPYFIPTDSLMQALSMSARRGIDVRIIVPGRSNQRFADLARGAYLRSLARDGCRCFLVAGSMVHAKVVLIDDRAFVGSANFDSRSLMLNFELMILFGDPDRLQELEGWADGLIRNAREAPPVSRGAYRLLEAVVRLTSPML
ncbi:phospholipase D-like domain-containing protein [Frigidibacter sp. ROC022]|uniref:phospholipase D-like domain-containing protein n=1 Tax=Frigidibacter sp. ROC022 TaxID=2971796 RepID=UPI00215A53D6|nr:phospholipase D-like domain-containing protein [Frigidibacter sp. ROC022]MCR8725729.1 phospholipase D-like domain-containing protein [Frigidibacter sp. ROC022]